MSSGPADVTVERAIHVDHHEADRQLHQSLELTCSSPGLSTGSYSRKHRRSPSAATFESEYLSEVSGQFDDADEPDSPLPEPPKIRSASKDCSPSSHSVKRRRSNDWPRRSPAATDDESTARREPTSGPRRRWLFHKGSGSAHGSPRSPRYARPARRSRFVEGHMNDSVSEKPPSIFLRDGAQNDIAGDNSSRQSGIFRFGKAIASAFNPFGGWGNVSDIWKGSHEGNHAHSSTDDPMAQVERAYEELKRSGYKGTVKGSYMKSLHAAESMALPDQTWRLIQAKTDYGGVCHSRHGSSHGQESGISLRSPFPDLRKAKSSLGIPSIRRSSNEMSSLVQQIDTHGQEVRHQKSRKEMQRQAKLLKRVSDLEGKLERARRELRELTGDEGHPICISYGEKSFQKKFVLGGLPTLPSERLLDNEQVPPPLSGLSVPLSPLPENKGPQAADGQCQDPEHGKPKRLVTPKARGASSSSLPRTSDNPSLKRKSPNPESRSTTLPPGHSQQPQQQARQEKQAQSPQKQDDAISAAPHPASEEVDVNTPERPPSRRAKLPKTARGESPGSVERKQKQRLQSPSSPADERLSRPSQRPLRSTNLRNRSATPVLRMKKGRADLRSASTTITSSPGPECHSEENKENRQEYNDSTEAASKEHYDDKIEKDLPDLPLDMDRQTQSPTPARRKARYEYIPPVPPLPKDLAATAAKVDRRLAREMGKRRIRGRRGEEGFQWPEDIF